MRYDVVIIGSGLGGLECGYILSKNGYRVCLLEKNRQIGGCLQTFRRGKTTFDTGFHYVGGLEEGQSLYPLFRYFGLLDLPWRKMDENGFTEVSLNGGRPYFIASGHERFVETLSADFPRQRRQIARYAAFLKQVGAGISDSFLSKGGEFSAASLFERSAYSFLQETIDDPLLRNVLSGASPTMELAAGTLPLYVFAQINNSFIQSAWRLEGGGSQIAEKLAESIRQMGGVILAKTEATRLTEKDGVITGVQCNGEEEISGKYVISNLHPALTLSLIPESRCIRSIYRKRIDALPNTFGMFTTHLQLKENALPYLNRNICLYRGNHLWDENRFVPGAKTGAVLVCHGMPERGADRTGNIDILTPMGWQEVAPWADTSVGCRGGDYADFKERKAEECIEFVAERIPGLKDLIERTYTSTPLTYRDYTGTREGAAYGIRKDCTRLMYTMLAPQTQISNLLLTGQNLNLHGVLGVSMTSFFTCAKIIGMEKLLKELNDAQ
jgi:all-trans-retinol 13,14-reductase